MHNIEGRGSSLLVSCVLCRRGEGTEICLSPASLEHAEEAEKRKVLASCERADEKTP